MSTSDSPVPPSPNGAQRLALDRLRAYEKWAYGMFIHFGMSTYDGNEFSLGDWPSNAYAPEKLDVDQWVSVARDAGMKYAVLTTKHVSGHCLWPTAWNDYHVGTSGNPTDVVEAFVNACRKRGVIPGFYYCSWDNHNVFGSKTPTDVGWQLFYTSSEYEEFHWRQTGELLTKYGEIGEFWLDIPHALSRGFRQQLYTYMAELQPDMVVVANNGQCAEPYPAHLAWPTDARTYERYDPWLEVAGQRYYVPGEACETMAESWFYDPAAPLRPVNELLGYCLMARTRGVNFLLDVPPDRYGLIPNHYVQHLMALRAAMDRVGF